MKDDDSFIKNMCEHWKADNKMKNINREEQIDQFLKEVGNIWKQYPEYRFGQMLENMKLSEGLPNIFFVTDDDILDMLRIHMSSLVSSID